MGNTPLHYAFQKRHAEVVQLLLDKGASKNVINEFDKMPGTTDKGMNLRSIELDNTSVVGFLLCDAARSFCQEVQSAMLKRLLPEVATQVPRLFVPLQKLAGPPGAFSCAVFPVPRLTKEERTTRSHLELPDVQIDLAHGKVRFPLDGFGMIEGIEVIGREDVHAALNAFAYRVGANK